MLNQKFAKAVSLSACTLILASPAWAKPSVQDTAKKLGHQGVYGKDSLNSNEDQEQTSQDNQDQEVQGYREETEEERKEREAKLKAKYPLSTTERTATNQSAHTHLLKGIQLYYLSRHIFEAANDISGHYDAEHYVLEIKQKGIIKSRIGPKDLLLYGAEYAYIGLRIRALQEAETALNEAVSNFSQAKSLAPTVGVIGKWLRIAQDTRKAVRFHIRFYQISLKAVERGATKEQLEQMAMVWKAPRNLGPNDSLTTRVYTYGLNLLRPDSKDKTSDKEKVNMDDFKKKLPDLDFQVKDN